MVDAWPASLPQGTLRADYDQGMGDGRRVSETDMGPGKVIRRSSAIASPLGAGMVMNAAQLATFETFVETTLSGGTLPFSFPDPRDGESTLLVRFRPTEMPSWRAVGAGHYHVRLPLEILP